MTVSTENTANSRADQLATLLLIRIAKNDSPFF